MPDLDHAIWQRYRDSGVRVYGVHPGESAQQLADFVEQSGITFPLLADLGTRTMFEYPQGVGYPYPRDVVIDEELVVRSIRNSFDASEMDALVRGLSSE